MKNLVIVESPTKARTIGKFLGSDYAIKASMGHLMDLPKSSLAVDIEHDFKPDYQLIEEKKKIISELKSSAKDAQKIILATDPDREGEAIASHVAEILRYKDTKILSEKKEKNHLISQYPNIPISFQRVVFHEITKEAIEEAFQNPRSIDNHLVDAQTARRVLDRLVGYKLSPLLWKKVRRGLSAGRVQSVALRLIVEREREIEKFKKEDYWVIKALLVQTNIHSSRKSKSSPSEEKFSVVQRSVPRSSALTTEFELIEINGEKIEMQKSFNLYDGEYRVTKTTIDQKEKADQIVKDLKTKSFIVSDVTSKKINRSPASPFTTSTLQQDAARRFGFSGKKTMILAQKLYEEGFITYHRTDSVNLSLQAVDSMRAFIKKEYGDKYLPQAPRFYKTKQKLAQEAHEAIRPTSFNQITNHKSQITNLGRDHFRLYELIWRRAIACQMSDAIIESTTVIVDSKYKISNIKYQKENTYRLKASGSVLVFEGFLKINSQALQDKKLPEFKTSDNLSAIDILAEKKETSAPARYNDASLIATLEEKGIGRPSTYATIVSTIESRRYIERNEGRFVPTSIGIAVNDFLVANFSDIDDIPFTVEMEDHLDNVATGQKDWVLMMKDFYKPFAEKLKDTEKVERVKIEVEKTDEKCPQCQSPLIVRLGKFGKFLSCSKFPDCKFTKSFIEETNFTCPKCNSKIIVRKTKKGRKFYGCSNYPICKFAAWKIEDIK